MKRIFKLRPSSSLCNQRSIADLKTNQLPFLERETPSKRSSSIIISAKIISRESSGSADTLIEISPRLSSTRRNEGLNGPSPMVMTSVIKPSKSSAIWRCFQALSSLLAEDHSLALEVSATGTGRVLVGLEHPTKTVATAAKRHAFSSFIPGSPSPSITTNFAGFAGLDKSRPRAW